MQQLNQAVLGQVSYNDELNKLRRQYKSKLDIVSGTIRSIITVYTAQVPDTTPRARTPGDRPHEPALAAAGPAGQGPLPVQYPSPPTLGPSLG